MIDKPESAGGQQGQEEKLWMVTEKLAELVCRYVPSPVPGFSEPSF